MKRGSAKAWGKKSGVPSARASDAAERSPAVYFANLKADMLLQKQMQVLKRAENSLVHRIVIDQKILFRRFQAKLRRSKLARARLWEDKEAERELRARDLHVLNTNCAQEQDDFEFLKKLERRPCIVDDSRLEKAKPKPDTEAPGVTDKDMEELIRLVMEDQDLIPTEKNLKSLSTIGHLMEEARLVSSAKSSNQRQSETKSASKEPRELSPKVTIRPVTTAGSRTDAKVEFTNKTNQPSRKVPSHTAKNGQLVKETDERRPQTSKSGKQNQLGCKEKNKHRPLTSPAWSQHRGKLRQKSPDSQTISRTSPATRRKSVHGDISTDNGSPCTGSRRPSRAVASMFEEQKKVDLVALRLEEARNTDHTPKVSAFIKSLLELDKRERSKSTRVAMSGAEPEEPFAETTANVESQTQAEKEEDEEERIEELKGDRKFDYYATKMALYAASVKKDPRASLPGTPEEVNMKLIGDQTIKSITMPALFLDFDDQEIAEIDQDHHESYLSYGPTNVLTLQDEQ